MRGKGEVQGKAKAAGWQELDLDSYSYGVSRVTGQVSRVLDGSAQAM